MAVNKRKGLGKGLDALFEDNHVEEKAVVQLKISQIEPNPNQPRSQFDDAALRELADSIREHGVLQPLLVRPFGDSYQIVAGERRWRASRMAGITELPVVIKELNDTQTLEIGIIENLQREDLNPIELALGYKSLMDEYSLTQEEVAKRVGKSRPVIANTVRLLSLPEEIFPSIKAGDITTGHAKALLAVEDKDLIIELADRILKDNLLVRDIERIAREGKQESTPNKSKENNIAKKPELWGNSYYKEVELALESEFGRKVNIIEKGGKTTLSLDFYDRSELEDFVKQISTKK